MPACGSYTSCVATTTAVEAAAADDVNFAINAAAPAEPRAVFMGGSVRQASFAGSYSKASVPAPLCTEPTKPPNA